VSDDSRDPEPLDVLKGLFSSELAGFFTSTIGRVEKVNTTRQTVDVQPLVRRRFMRESGEYGNERRPVATDVPVAFTGAGGNRLTFPIAVGSIVLLVHVSHAMDRWLLVGREVDDATGSRNTLNEVVAFPVGHAFAGPARPQTTWPQDAVVLHCQAQFLRLVSPSANEIVAINSELAALTTKFNELREKFNAHIHIDSLVEATTGPMSAPAVPSIASAAATPNGSPRVRVPSGGGVLA
jgi:hypothetical protein